MTCDGCIYRHFVSALPYGSSRSGWGCSLTDGHAIERCDEFDDGEEARGGMFEFDLDEHFEDIWHALERFQDGNYGHVVAFYGIDAHQAAQRMADALVPFFERRMVKHEP